MSYNSFGKLIMIFLNYPNKIFVFIHSNLNLLAPNHIIETNVKGKKKIEKEERMIVTIELSRHLYYQFIIIIIHIVTQLNFR